MNSRKICVLFLFVLIGQSVTQNTNSFTISLIDGWEYQCVNTTCAPFATVVVSNIRMCQVACLNEVQCKAASFHQSTSKCQLFSDIPDENGNMLANMETVTMFVMAQTRMPSELTTSTTATATSSSTTTTTPSSTSSTTSSTTTTTDTTTTTTSSSTSSTTDTTTTTTSSTTSSSTTTTTDTTTTTTSSSTSSTTDTTTTTTTTTATDTTTTTTGISGMYWNTTASSRAGTGTSGAGLNQLSAPTGIFLDSSDNLYVADSGNYRVLKYAPGVTNGTLIAGANVTGTTLNLLSTGIRYIFVDSSQNLYVADTYNNRVMFWANGSSSGIIVAGNGSYGTSFNEIYNPYGIWVDSSSNVYVAEYQNQRVTKWASGATTSILVAGNTSSAGNTTSKLSSPAGLVYDEANQDLYIANSATATSTVMKWHVGDPNATVIAGISGSPGNSTTQLNSPMAIVLDQWKNLYVADRTNNRVQLFCNGNTTGITIAGSGAGGTTLSAPYDVKLDSRLNLYVSLNSGARIRLFAKL
ncbi:unnamed protein product [Adineta steineri]|uniref:Apple domain-containing protein n=1 Tax=Adineta steineri TaxID=433720 RepID=A0A819P6V8_9BILA|nr:unnamed protein product [Adineta steineri]CAF4009645.1 unnamed protein product [Adineta steineri]